MSGHDTFRRRAIQLLFAAALTAAAVARADENDMFLQIDNDIFTGSDREYTNGMQVGSTSATVASIADAPFAPSLRWANKKLRWLQPKGLEENNVTWTIGQRM